MPAAGSDSSCFTLPVFAALPSLPVSPQAARTSKATATNAFFRSGKRAGVARSAIECFIGSDPLQDDFRLLTA